MKENFEDKLNKIVDNSTQYVDHSALWEGIENKLARKKRRVGIVWFIGLPLIFVFIGAIYIANYSPMESLPIDEMVEVETLVTENKIVSVGKNNYEKVNSSIIDEESSVNKNLEILAVQSKEIVQSADKKSPLLSALEQNETNPSSVKTNPTNLKYSNSILGLSPTKTLSFNQSENESSSETQSTVSEVSAESSTTKKEAVYLSFKEQYEIGSIARMKMMQLATKKRLVLAALTTLNPPKNVLDSPIKDDERKSNISFISEFTMFVMANNGIKSIENQLNTPYYNVRNSTESLLDVYSVGAKVALLQWKGLSINSGLRYNYLTDVFEWKGNVFRDLDRVYLESYLYTLDRGVLENFADNNVKVEFEKYVKKYDEHHLIDIPIGVAYQFKLNSFSFGAFADMNFSYKFESDIHYLDEELALTQGVSDNQWLKLNYSYGLSMNYAWNDHYSVGLNIERRSFDIDHIGIESSYKILGLGLQINRRF